MSEFKQYRRTNLAEMRPYVQGEDMTGISVSDPDKQLDTLEGGYVARNPENHEDKWYIAKDYFDVNFEPYFDVETEKVDTANAEEADGSKEKTLHNTTSDGASKNVSDLVIWGDGDMFKLLSKASSQNEGWMKSTKAMEIPGLGCLVQVTTQQRGLDGTYAVAEALAMVHGVTIEDGAKGVDSKPLARKLVKIKQQ